MFAWYKPSLTEHMTNMNNTQQTLRKSMAIKYMPVSLFDTSLTKS